MEPLPNINTWPDVVRELCNMEHQLTEIQLAQLVRIRQNMNIILKKAFEQNGEIHNGFNTGDEQGQICQDIQYIFDLYIEWSNRILPQCSNKLNDIKFGELLFFPGNDTNTYYCFKLDKLYKFEDEFKQLVGHENDVTKEFIRKAEIISRSLVDLVSETDKFKCNKKIQIAIDDTQAAIDEALNQKTPIWKTICEDHNLAQQNIEDLITIRSNMNTIIGYIPEGPINNGDDVELICQDIISIVDIYTTWVKIFYLVVIMVKRGW